NLLHILFKCYCFCLLMLETQIVQFVQLENLAFFLGSPQKYKPTETHQNALMVKIFIYHYCYLLILFYFDGNILSL
uniref:Uncharacterized protein n=1 Tax=Propithecus coquereli TaxID=379532 RepID=A0A2K6G191_PROCO